MAGQISKKKWEFTKMQSIVVVVIGTLLLAPALLITTDPETTAHTVKVVFGFIGACVVFIGVWRRPMNVETIK